MKDTNKYEALDQLIMSKMGERPQAFGAINVGDVRIESERLAVAEGKNVKDEAFRYVDRRLQALRKAGRISATSKGWIIVLPKAA